MRRLRFTLLGDGSSDEALIRHLDWLIRTYVSADVAVEAYWADLRGVPSRPAGLKARMVATLEFYPCELLFVHRDAEKEPPQNRVHEIEKAWTESACPGVCVPVIPVRMSEAWLLVEETAIRKASGNPNGMEPLDLPPIKEIERLIDPKNTLQQALRRASGLTGRRLKAFKPRPRLVAEYMENFETLRALPAFVQLETSLRQVLSEMKLLGPGLEVRGKESSESEAQGKPGGKTQ